MTELQSVLPGSAETWRSTAPTPQVPEELLPPKSGSRSAVASLAAPPPAA